MRWTEASLLGLKTPSTETPPKSHPGTAASLKAAVLVTGIVTVGGHHGAPHHAQDAGLPKLLSKLFTEHPGSKHMSTYQRR